MSAPGAGPYGVPPQGFQQPYGPPRRRWGAVIAGLVIGLVVGAGGLGLAWGLSSGSSGTADYDAVCDLVARTEPLTEKFELGDMRRLAGVGELAAALAEDDAAHKPLATALEESVRAGQVFDLDESSTALRRAQDICQA